MNKEEFTVETGLEIHDCLTCGISYAMPTEFIEGRREDHKSFYCPNGHKMYYPQMTKEEKLKRKLKSCELSHRILEVENRYHDYRARYYKGKVTKIQKAKEVQL